MLPERILFSENRVEPALSDGALIAKTSRILLAYLRVLDNTANPKISWTQLMPVITILAEVLRDLVSRADVRRI
jgi:hypothetical protein